jgi:hypothetical protein
MPKPTSGVFEFVSGLEQIGVDRIEFPTSLFGSSILGNYSSHQPAGVPVTS